VRDEERESLLSQGRQCFDPMDSRFLFEDWARSRGMNSLFIPKVMAFCFPPQVVLEGIAPGTAFL
jgi:hypothetical protein